MKHKELVRLGKLWLRRNGCAVVVTEITNTSSLETPDIIGFRYMESIVIEVKTSRADFLADRKKAFRQNPAEGMGNIRYYLVPKGLVKRNELPSRWSLLECSSSGRIFASEKPHLWGGPRGEPWRHESNQEAEKGLLYSIARRLATRLGDLDNILHGDLVKA